MSIPRLDLLAGASKEEVLDLLEHTTDQAVIASIARHAADMSVRLEAIRQLTNQSALVELAYTEKEGFLRGKTINKIEIEPILLDIAQNAEYPHDRLSALMRLKRDENRELFARLACEDPDDSVRVHAVIGLKRGGENLPIFEEIARHDKADLVRRWAVRKMGRGYFLDEAARRDESPRVRYAAVKRVTSARLLFKIAGRDHSLSVRRAALRRLAHLARHGKHC